MTTITIITVTMTQSLPVMDRKMVLTILSLFLTDHVEGLLTSYNDLVCYHCHGNSC